jgi:hypothetical protein
MLAALEEDRARVADLEAQISHLERSLSTLRKEKTLVQERLNSYKYPVLELPNEIISDVFIHFLPPYPECPPLNGLLSPTLLTHICRRWREIALGTPALWRAISSYNNCIPFHAHASIFGIWLERSRLCPLSLRFGASRPHADKLLATVVPHRSRWEHLDLSLWQFHLSILEGPMPMLKQLHLTLPASGSGEVFAFREVPLLRKVILNDAAASGVTLPWAQLTSLTLLNVYPYECVPILQQTPNLVRSKLQVVFHHQPGPDIALPCLESLTLELAASSGRPVKDFLQTFIVPALRSLEIPETILNVPVESLTAFISKSNCKLEELHITGPRSVPKSAYRKAFPSIRKFSFTGDYYGLDDDEDLSDSSEPSGAEGDLN